MEHELAVGPLVDTGLAPEIYVSGLGAAKMVDRDVARLTFFTNQAEGPARLVRATLIIPLAAIGPGFDLLVQQLGANVLRGRPGSGVGMVM